MKILLIVLLGCSLMGVLTGCDPSTETGVKSISQSNQVKAADQINELADYVTTNRDTIVHYVQVAEPGTKDWNTLTKLFDKIKGGNKVVGYLDAPYDDEEQKIASLAAMATHFEIYMNDRNGRAEEFTRGMESLKEFEQIK